MYELEAFNKLKKIFNAYVEEKTKRTVYDDNNHFFNFFIHRVLVDNLNNVYLEYSEYQKSMLGSLLGFHLPYGYMEQEIYFVMKFPEHLFNDDAKKFIKVTDEMCIKYPDYPIYSERQNGRFNLIWKLSAEGINSLSINELKKAVRLEINSMIDIFEEMNAF